MHPSPTYFVHEVQISAADRVWWWVVWWVEEKDGKNDESEQSEVHLCVIRVVDVKLPNTGEVK